MSAAAAQDRPLIKTRCFFDLGPFRDPRLGVPSWIWWVLLCLAISLRLGQIWQEAAYLHPDAIYQALEPAYHLVFGHGDLPWEYREGARSWLWPALLAIPLRACQATSSCGPGIGMQLGVAWMRAVATSIDVLAACVAVRWTLRMTLPTSSRGFPALAVAIVLAAHPAFTVMGAQPLIDVPAAALAIAACERAWLLRSMLPLSRSLNRTQDEAEEHPVAQVAHLRRHAMWLAGLLAGSTLLRVQLAPLALGLMLLVLIDLIRAEKLREVGGAALSCAVAVAVTFMLADLIAWGSPFHSWIVYFGHHLAAEGPSAALMPADRYWRDLNLAMPLLGPVALVLSIGAIGWTRVPSTTRDGWSDPTIPLASLALIVLPHQFIALKVWRFLYPAQSLLVIAAALGASSLATFMSAGHTEMDRAATRVTARTRILRGIALTAALAGVGLGHVRRAPWETTWLYDQAGWPAIERTRVTTQAYLWLSTRPAPTRVIQAVLPAVAVPGHVFLGHDVPVVHAAGRQPAREELVGADTWILEADAGYPDSVREVWRSDDGTILIVQRPPP